ncbi:hypothetical protein FRC12_005137 [Ceratobasidium sp. 428]|nr:hypothetical protein FRC12_005137 [Ceratobasidium sp. 428]
MEVHINATKPFEYYLRMPQWALGEDTVTIKGASFGDMPTTIQSQSIKVNINLGIRYFVWSLTSLYGLSLVLETWSRYTVETSSMHMTYQGLRIMIGLQNEPRAVDLRILPDGPWQYAIDPSTVQYQQTSEQVNSPVFDRGGSSTSLLVTACLVKWETAGETFADAPPENPECVRPLETIRLIPYGVSLKPLVLCMFLLN